MTSPFHRFEARAFTPLRRGRRGASLTGYGLIVGLIAVIAIAATTRVGEGVVEMFGGVGAELTGLIDETRGDSGSSEEIDPAPTLTLVDPSSGDNDTATPVTLSGMNFDDPGSSAVTVTFGGVAASNVTVIDATQISATTPASLADVTVDVTVVTADGQSVTAPGAFAFEAPQILAGFGETCPPDPDPVMDIGCTDGSGNTEAIYAGEIGGGTGDPALYIAPDDETAGGNYLEWSSSSDTASSGNNGSDGEGNMATFIPLSNFEAAEACANRAPAGTWFLPARDELADIWTGLVAPFVTAGVVSVDIGSDPGESQVPPGSDLAALGFDFQGNFTDGRYWSSSDTSDCAVRFDRGDPNNCIKANIASVRCARR